MFGMLDHCRNQRLPDTKKKTVTKEDLLASYSLTIELNKKRHPGQPECLYKKFMFRLI